MTHPALPATTCFETTIADGVAHIRLNRPEAANAMNRAFWSELPALVQAIDHGALARCIVLSAAGRHFTSGMDLSVFEGVTGGATSGTQGGSTGDGGAAADPHCTAEAFRHLVLHLQRSFSCLDQARIPVLAAIQGACIGGGVDLASACDIRWATADAYFCIQEINIGMTADVGTFPRLCKLIPEGWVRELAYTGRRLDAAKAKEIGLVNEVFDTHEAMLAHVLATAREIAAKAPLAVTGSKVMINHARDHSTADSLDYIALWQTGMFSGAHMAEAFAAKQAKRAPVFPDLAPLRRGL